MTCSKHGLLTKATLFDFLHEKLITLVPFSIALIALFRYAEGLRWPLLYLAIIGAHMIHMLVQRCPHCAYYKQDTRFLECLMIRWIPKFRKAKNGPLPKYLRLYTPIAVLAISIFPLYWLMFQWELLILYSLSWGVLVLSIYASGCRRCIDFGCRYNAVPKSTREAYLSAEKNA